MSDADPLPRVARIDERGAAIGEVERRLSTECPASFAGVAFATDGILDVYSTGDDRLTLLVADLAPATGRFFQLRVHSGMRNSLRDLEDVHRQVRARWTELRARGVISCGVDIPSNRFRIGVRELTPAITAELEAQFGAERVRIVKGQLFQAVTGG